MHFTSTSSFWLNRVERFCGEFSADCIRDGSFQSVRQLVDATVDYLAARHENPLARSLVSTGGAVEAERDPSRPPTREREGYGI